MTDSRKNKIAFLAILLVAVLARTVMFGSVPGGLNQDEAFAAYDAWSIMTSGVDSAGYKYPVYLTAWGSGMNALETYLMIPLFALFGTAEWVVRLPQLIIALLSVVAAYALAKRLSGERMALCFMAMLAICPWHIMLSRWALESNLAPGFILFGMYFFVRALEDRRFMLLSALMYGLSLYCYATIWPIVPLIILLQIIYARKKLRIDRYTVSSVLILALMALPLLLFLAVNKGLIEEICLPFMSIPKLLVMRSEEISLRHIPDNLKNLLTVFITQNDGFYWNSPGKVGILYFISLPFCLLGIGLAIKAVIKKSEVILDGLMLIQLFGAVLLGALIWVNVNRVNILFIPLVYFTARGIVFICEKLGKTAKYIVIAAYVVLFTWFCGYYFGEFSQLSSYYFNDGLKEALEAVEDRPGTVYLDEDIYHSQVLFYTKMDQQHYADTVEYLFYPQAYLCAESYGRFVRGVNSTEAEDEAFYIVKKQKDKENLIEAGFTLENYGYIALAYK